MPSSVAICLALTTLAPAAVVVDVQTLDGRTLRGEVTAWTTDGITLLGKEGPQQLGRAELLGVRGARAAAIPPTEATGPTSQWPAAWLELVDGTRLVGSGFTLADGSGRLRRTTGDDVEIPA